MILAHFVMKLHNILRERDSMMTDVRVQSTYWSKQLGHMVSAPVMDIGIDEKTGCVLIQINKTGDDEI